MQEYGGLIRGQGHRLERLVDEVLLFTAGRFGLAGYEMKPLEIREVVTQSLAVAENNLREAGFIVRKEIEHELPPILADPSAVVTCVENLVSNAVKYSNSSKWIGIRAYQSKADSKPEVRISVEDKGLGIARSDLPHIYEPFYRAQYVRDHQIRGVGLGLYLVKRMMEDMGGQVSVTSELGRGTTVVLHFPITSVAEDSESTV
jgi:signal transduction histidine kinase